jgi:hypothetical protein
LTCSKRGSLRVVRLQARQRLVGLPLTFTGRNEPAGLNEEAHMSGTQVRPLAKLLNLLARYVVMTDEQRLLVALWIVHTHCVQHFEQTPYLCITSPERQCGKSRLLELLDLLVARAWSSVMPSEAVLYRRITQDMPTLLLDEVDAVFTPGGGDRYEGLRACLNAGHRRGAKVPRMQNFTTVVEFDVYCAKALAGIGVMPSTITDRAIPIRLQRKTPEERVARYFRREVEPVASELRAGMEEWTAAVGAALGRAHPEMPAALSDRMQEGCEPLVAIADALGYGTEAREALVSLFTGERDDEEDTAALRLLSDIRDIFSATEAKAVHSERLCMALAANGNGWGNWYGRTIAPADVAKMLKQYGVRPKNVRNSDGLRKGYHRDDLAEAFERYLPMFLADEVIEYDDGSEVTEVTDCDVLFL